MTQSIPVRKDHALLVVDVQNDFCPEGLLGVKDGDKIIPIINKIIPLFNHVVFSRDWHPANHCSFSKTPTYTDGSWPSHCVADTHGAAFHHSIQIPEDALIVNKGTKCDREEYSGFSAPELEPWLRKHGVEMVYICGLATDYCVRFSAMDALAMGFRVRLVTDAIQGVDVPEGSARKAIEKMVQAGVEPIRSDQLLKVRKK